VYSTSRFALRLVVGDPGDMDSWGSGMIPKEALADWSRRSGVSDALDGISVMHGGGGDVQAGRSALNFKSYDQFHAAGARFRERSFMAGNQFASSLGLMTSVYFLTFAAAQLPLGVMLDRYGGRRVQSGLLLVAVAGAALNLLHIGGAFVLQEAIGLIVNRWPSLGGHYPPLAYKTALALIVLLQIGGIIWFVPSLRMARAPQSQPAE
jgi:MFS family permease